MSNIETMLNTKNFFIIGKLPKICMYTYLHMMFLNGKSFSLLQAHFLMSSYLYLHHNWSFPLSAPLPASTSYVYTLNLFLKSPFQNSFSSSGSEKVDMCYFQVHYVYIFYNSSYLQFKLSAIFYFIQILFLVWCTL